MSEWRLRADPAGIPCPESPEPSPEFPPCCQAAHPSRKTPAQAGTRHRGCRQRGGVLGGVTPSFSPSLRCCYVLSPVFPVQLLSTRWLCATPPSKSPLSCKASQPRFGLKRIKTLSPAEW